MASSSVSLISSLDWRWERFSGLTYLLDPEVEEVFRRIDDETRMRKIV